LVSSWFAEGGDLTMLSKCRKEVQEKKKRKKM